MDKTKKNSVLVVDDEKSNIMTLAHILSADYTVYAAKNGEDAVKTAEKLLPDIILLDIIMPEMNGYDVITTLKASEKTKDIPVIFITGLNNADDEQKGLALGAADYIIKPFSPAIVKLRVNNQMKTLEQMQLNIEKGRAEKNSRARIDFLIRMSHEMLTPMNVIMGMTQALKMSEVTDKQKKSIDEIGTASKYLLRLIHDLLDVSGKKEGAFTLNNKFFSFNSMFMDIYREVDHDAVKKLQTLSLEIDPLIPVVLYGDEERLAQVITNLLTNAVKFTPEHGEIHFSTHVINELNDEITLQVEVADNGEGIPKNRQGEIFSLFEQGDKSMTRERGGVGLGLPISKRIIEMMGGNLWLESEPDKGSKFMFTCKMKKG